MAASCRDPEVTAWCADRVNYEGIAFWDRMSTSHGFTSRLDNPVTDADRERALPDPSTHPQGSLTDLEKLVLEAAGPPSEFHLGERLITVSPPEPLLEARRVPSPRLTPTNRALRRSGGE